MYTNICFIIASVITIMDLSSVKTTSVQIIIFNSNFSSHTSMFSSLLKLNSVFDGDTVLLPVPPEAPSDIPVIILSSKSKLYNLEISRDRLTFTGSVDIDQNDIDFKYIFDVYKKIIRIYQKGIKPQFINRIAIIKNQIYLCDNPSKEMTNYFCSEDCKNIIFSEIEGFELSSYKKINLMVDKNQLNVNSWIRFKSGYFKDENRNAILIQQDINTIKTDDKLKENVIQYFPSYFIDKHSEILKTIIK